MARLRIATFNLESLDDEPGAVPALSQRIAVLRPQLRRLEADLLCFQEVNAQAVARHLPRRLTALDHLLEDTLYLGYNRALTGPIAHDGPAERHNLALLSRYPIAASRQIHHELVPPLSYRLVTASPPAKEALTLSWDRPLLYAAIEFPGGRRLHVLNLHLKAPLAVAIPGQKVSAAEWRSVGGWAEGFFLAAMKRAGQALEARLVVERLFDADASALIAVCGDFNAEARETPVRVLIGGERDGSGRARSERMLTALEESVPAPRRYSVLHAGRPLLLDHLLVSPALAAWPYRVEIQNEGLSDEARDPLSAHPSLGSYHAPIVAEFEMAD
ncbi:MAG TPA: endonuclease/exonuclease/phosphatase family protein [Alphaproteobacteria bacterium]|nr:endonuclease/exonuclease/phosphatase family protein [Alphaproteobacteria bacterium]